MQILIQTGRTTKPKVYELTKDKVKFLMQFVDYLADDTIVDTIDENSDDYKSFFENEVKKAMKTKRVKSGNSLRNII